MKKNHKNLITISDETQIERPASREMIPVEKADWRRIKRLIEKIDISSSRWEQSASFMAAATLAFFIEWIKQVDDKWRGIFLALFISSFIVTVILFIVAFRFSKIRRDSKKEVLIELDEMEKKTTKEAEENMVEPDELRILEAIYGTEESNKDITQELKALVKNNKLSVRTSNDIAGDPHPGVVKKLKIRYEFQYKEIEKEYIEGEVVNLP